MEEEDSEGEKNPTKTKNPKNHPHSKKNALTVAITLQTLQNVA